MTGEDIDTGADISTIQAECREILQIPGYRLSKPLEIAVVGHRERGAVTQYSATHYLPSSQYERGAPTGNALVGIGNTPEEAGDNLGELIKDIWANLKGMPDKELWPEARLQKQYLSALFLE